MDKRLNSTAFIIVVSALLFQVGLQSYMRPYALDGLYFQSYSSETIMQTVSIVDLRDAPLETLLNIHIQPPGLDLIRAILIHIFPVPDSVTLLLRHVDYWLYKLWSVLYGILGIIVFSWTYKRTGAKFFSLGSTAAFLLHPACLFYTTYLDSTLLTSVLVLSFYYLLWRIKNNYAVPIALLLFVLLALFFTRSIFGLSFIFIAFASMLLVGMSKRRALVILLITSSIAGLYMLKQYYQFGIFSTSSFVGLNLNRSIGNDMMQDYWDYLKTKEVPANQEQDNELPQTLIRKQKHDGSTNFNHLAYLQLNQQLIKQYQEDISTVPPRQLIESYIQNLRIYFQPSSRYTNHQIVDRIPWRTFYDQIFAFPILLLLILLLGIAWLLNTNTGRDYIATFGFLLPGLFIFVVTIFFEKGENHRFKFFLEPIIFVFLASQLYFTIRKFFTSKTRPSHAIQIRN